MQNCNFMFTFIQFFTLSFVYTAHCTHKCGYGTRQHYIEWLTAANTRVRDLHRRRYSCDQSRDQWTAIRSIAILKWTVMFCWPWNGNVHTVHVVVHSLMMYDCGLRWNILECLKPDYYPRNGPIAKKRLTILNELYTILSH